MWLSTRPANTQHCYNIALESCEQRLYYNIYILNVFTEKPYSKPLERNIVYIPRITLSHATSHAIKWRQNKPWLSTIWLDVGDVMTSLKLRVNVFLLQF